MKKQSRKFRKYDIVEVIGMHALNVGIVGTGEIVKVDDSDSSDVNYYWVDFKDNQPSLRIEEKHLKLVSRPFFGRLFRGICKKIPLPFIHCHISIPFIQITSHLMYTNLNSNMFEFVMWDVRIWKWRFEFSLYTKPKRINHPFTRNLKE